MLEKQVILLKKETPENWSHQAADFISKYIQRKPLNSFGYEGVSEVKFKDLLEKKQIPTPFVPVYM